ncbi:MAG: MATE family efflux transporter [Rhodospirillales bacterium]
MYEAPIRPGETWFAARLRRHLGELIRLAVPTVISRFGVLMIAQVDAVMVGHAATAELAYLNIGNAVVINIIVACMGLLLGTLVMTSNAFGAEDYRACGAAWRRSLPMACGLGLIGLTIAWQGRDLMEILGQTGDLAAGSGAVAHIMGIGVLPVLIFLTTNFFLEGLRRPLPGMVLMLLANLLNVGLNWVFIYGVGSVPAMGAEGAAWATTIVRWALAFSIVAYVWWLPDRDRFGLRQPDPDPAAGRIQRRIGYATGLGMATESAAFTAMILFAGWLGELSAAAYGIAFNLLALFFMVAIGIGGATSVRVGIAFGRRDRADMELAGWTGLGANTVLAGGIGLLIFFQSDLLVSFYTSDPALVPIARSLVVVVAGVLVLDGGQAVLAQALRGRRDVWAPMVCQLACYGGVMVPVAYWMAIPLGYGVQGLIWTVMGASAISIILLAGRFRLLARRPLG